MRAGPCPRGLLRSVRPPSRRSLALPHRRYATDPAPPPPQPNHPPKEPSRVGAYYKSFSYPVLKCFLGALFTYQLAYYAWMKLEVIEEQHDAATRIAGLKTDLRDAVVEQRAKAREAVATTAAAATTGEEGKGGVGQDKDEGGKKKKGWLGW